MKRKIFYNTVRGMSMIEVLVSLSILSTTLLACMAFAINSLQRCRSCLWDTGSISSYSAFFERLQLYPNRLIDDPERLAHEVERFKQSLQYQAPLISVHLLENGKEKKILMIHNEKRVETLIQ